jgi:PhnB protein
MKHVTAYLNFDGNCREAMQFYHKCLGTEIQMNAYPDAKGQPSNDPSARIMHSQLLRNGQPILMASDTPPGSAFRLGNNLSVAVECDSVEEIERLFTAVGQKGQMRVPLGNMPWGARFGMLTDQFGVQWLFNCASPR